MKKYLTRYAIILAIVSIVLVIDLTFKHFFCFEESKTIIPYIFNFQTNNGNSGAAFGMFSGKRWGLVLMTLICLAVFVAYDLWQKPKSKTYLLGFSFVLGGAIGNLVDRLRFGYVRDFINFTFWKDFPTFNIADSFLCIGVVLVCIYFVFFSNKKDKNISTNKNTTDSIKQADNIYNVNEINNINSVNETNKINSENETDDNK